MKKSLGLISSSTLCVALMACSTAAPAPSGSAGASNGGGGSPAEGGAAPSAGAPSAGAPAGGSPAEGGGTNSAGSSGASTSAGAGGTPGAAGMGAGGAPAGGAGGSAGMPGTAGAAGAATVDATMFSGGWDGALLEYPCGSKGSSVDCPQDNTCVSVDGKSPAQPSFVIPPKLNGQVTKSTWTMGGTPGTIYDVHVLIRGVTEAYNYVGGTIDKTTGTPDSRLDLFGEDGAPQSNASTTNGSDYNSFILTVTPPTGAAKTYNLNAVQNNENPHTSQLTQHRSFKITEDKHIKIAGGSTVKMEVGDSNCVEIMNCGTQAGGSCNTPWTIPLTGSMPPIPATGSFDQPFSANGSYGQWISFDVLDVSVAK